MSSLSWQKPWERRLVFLVNISFVGKKTLIMVNIFRAKCFKLSVNISYKMHQIVKRNTWYRAIDSRNEICSSGPDDQRWDCCWWRGCWSSSCWRWWWPVHGRRSRQWQGLVRCWWVACHRGNPTECRMADDGKMARVPKLPHMEGNMQVKPDSDAWTSARSRDNFRLETDWGAGLSNNTEAEGLACMCRDTRQHYRLSICWYFGWVWQILDQNQKQIQITIWWFFAKNGILTPKKVTLAILDKQMGLLTI